VLALGVVHRSSSSVKVMAPGGFVLSSFSLTSGDIVNAIVAWGESAAMPVSVAMARILGI